MIVSIESVFLLLCLFPGMIDEQNMSNQSRSCTSISTKDPFTSNMRIFIHGLCSTPEGLISALCEHCHQHYLSNIEVNEGISENTRIFSSEIPLFLISKHHNTNVSLYVSPPHSAGLCIRSLGVSVDIARSAAGSNLLVAAVNKHMARIYGKEKVHTCQFDNTSRR